MALHTAAWALQTRIFSLTFAICGSRSAGKLDNWTIYLFLGSSPLSPVERVAPPFEAFCQNIFEQAAGKFWVLETGNELPAPDTAFNLQFGLPELTLSASEAPP